MDYDAILQRERDRRVQDEETRATRTPVTAMDWTPQSERSFSETPGISNRVLQEMDTLDYMAATYRTIGDTESANALSDEAWHLMAAFNRKYGSDPRNIASAAVREAWHEPGNIPPTNEAATSAVARARDTAQTLHYASSQQKPRNVASYLANRELGRK